MTSDPYFFRSVAFKKDLVCLMFFFFCLSNLKNSSNIIFSFFEPFLIPLKGGFVDTVDWI